MIKKINRLTEKELKKVLKYNKPFFSYGFIANVQVNKDGYSRFGIIFSSKHTKNSIIRNFFRRKFYFLVQNYINKGSFNIVFVPKKGSKFDKESLECNQAFENDIKFLLKKIYG